MDLTNFYVWSYCTYPDKRLYCDDCLAVAESTQKIWEFSTSQSKASPTADTTKEIVDECLTMLEACCGSSPAKHRQIPSPRASTGRGSPIEASSMPLFVVATGRGNRISPPTSPRTSGRGISPREVRSPSPRSLTSSSPPPARPKSPNSSPRTRATTENPAIVVSRSRTGTGNPPIPLAMRTGSHARTTTICDDKTIGERASISETVEDRRERVARTRAALLERMEKKKKDRPASTIPGAHRTRVSASNIPMDVIQLGREFDSVSASAPNSRPGSIISRLSPRSRKGSASPPPVMKSTEPATFMLMPEEPKQDVLPKYLIPPESDSDNDFDKTCQDVFQANLNDEK